MSLKNLLIGYWSNLRSSYWFLPTVMTLLSLVLSVFLVQLDYYLGDEWVNDLSWFQAAQVDGARALLSTIAASMMTVAGVTFSMTLLSVSHASAQIGPRILTGFMNDRGNQITLGSFISTFVYCILIIPQVGINDLVNGTQHTAQPSNAFIPYISVASALVLMFFSVAMLIYFINHVPKTIGMSFAINRVGDSFLNQLNSKMWQVEHGEELESLDDFSKIQSNKNTLEICATSKGYLKHIDYERLFELTKKHKLNCQVTVQPGDFICEQDAVLKCSFPGEEDEEVSGELIKCFLWGVERSHDQDLRFTAQLLVEVAVRALSPGINDPFTANECLNQLRVGLLDLSKIDRGKRLCIKDDGEIRLVYEVICFDDLTKDVLQNLRTYVCTNFISTKYELVTLGRLNRELKNQTHIDLVSEEARLLCEAYTTANHDLDSKKIIKFFYNHFSGIPKQSS